MTGPLATAVVAGLLAAGALTLQAAGPDGDNAAGEASGGDGAYYGK